MDDNFLDSLLIFLVVLAIGLLLYLATFYNDLKDYAFLIIHLVSFAGSALAIYDFFIKKKN